MNKLSDFPKIQCPFVRKQYKINKDDWKKEGYSLQLRNPTVYLVTKEIAPGYEWVFDDPHTIAIEKLDGTNVKLQTENGRLIALQNRKNVIDPLQLLKGNNAIVEAVFMAIQKGYVEDNSIQAGEVIGRKLQGNPYKLDGHIWYPFDRAVKYLKYRSFHEHECTYENLSLWFKDYLKSRFHAKLVGMENAVFAEGIIFYNLERKTAGLTYRAKLRRDMFAWYYNDRVEIYGIDELK